MQEDECPVHGPEADAVGKCAGVFEAIMPLLSVSPASGTLVPLSECDGCVHHEFVGRIVPGGFDCLVGGRIIHASRLLLSRCWPGRGAFTASPRPSYFWRRLPHLLGCSSDANPCSNV